MADVKWIKLATGLPDNKKIKQIRKLPEGDTIALMWVFLLCLAGDTNEDGMIYLTPEIPFTDEMLAEEFKIDVNTIRLGLKTFQRFGMIEIIDDIIRLESWEKWQSTDRLADIREYNRIKKQESRARKKLLQQVNDMSLTCQPCQDIDKSRVEKIRKEEIRVDVVVDGEPFDNGNETEENVDKNVGNSFEYVGGQIGKGVVLLTNAQFDALLDKYGLDTTNHYIDKLATFILKNNAKVGNHYKTICEWIEEDMKV